MQSELDYINVKGLHLTYGKQSALQNINFDLEKGHFLALLGPNGSGKSSLLRLLLGFQKADQGEIYLEGKLISELSHARRSRSIAYLPGSLPFFYPQTVLNLVLTARFPYLGYLRGSGQPEKEYCLQVLEDLEIRHLAERFIHHLSDGERRLVFLARVLAQDCPLVLLDEPAANLDLHFSEFIFSYLDSMAEKGKTIIAAVHDINAASRYCSRLLLLNKGQQAAMGHPAQVLQKDIVEKVWKINIEIRKGDRGRPMLIPRGLQKGAFL